MIKIKTLLKDRSGFTITFQMLLCFLVLTIILCCLLGVGGIIHKRMVLNTFVDEMAIVAATNGKCKGNELELRYSQLKESTGLSPKIEYEAIYYNNTKKLVQYGESITVHLTLDSKMISWGKNYLPITLTAKSTRQSMEYWK